jgi:hypothetical protein
MGGKRLDGAELAAGVRRPRGAVRGVFTALAVALVAGPDLLRVRL